MTIVSPPAPPAPPGPRPAGGALIADQQRAAAWVLLDLVVEESLPTAYWALSDLPLPGCELRGQINRIPGRTSDDQLREAVTLWAQMFERGVIEADGDGYTELSTSARIDGVTVTIVAHLPEETVV